MANFFDQFDGKPGGGPDGGNFFDRFDAPRRAPAAPRAPETDQRPAPRGFAPAQPAPAPAAEAEPVDTYVPDVPFDARALPRPGQTARQTRAPEAPPSPFAGEPLSDTAARRGQQAAQGFTDVFASLPEAGAIAGEAADLTQKRETAQEILERQRTIDDIRARLEEPGLNERTRALLERNLADLEKGQEELTRRTEAPVVPAPQRSGFAAASRIRSWTEDTFGKPDPRDTTFWATLAQGGGNIVGFVATALAGAPLGPGGALAATGVAGSALNSSQVYKEAVAAGASQDEALAAARLAGLLGASEAIPITRALMVLPPRLRGEVSNQLVRRLASVAQSGGEEALQETIVGIGNNLIAQGYYDPERGTFEGVGEQALAGAILGGAVNVAGQGFDAAIAPAAGADRPPEQPAPPAAGTPPTPPAPERPIRRPDLLTPADIASPLPDDAIAAGKEILEAVEQGRPLPPPPPKAGVPQETEDPDRFEILPVTDGEGNETGEFVRFDSQTGAFTPVAAPGAAQPQETDASVTPPAPVPPLPSAPAPQGFGVAMDEQDEPPVTPEEIARAEREMRVARPTERKPENLMTFIVRQGGIWSGDANIGDVRQLDYRRPGLVKTNRMQRSTAGDNNVGLTLDEMRERAEEEGFLPPESTIADLLDLMDRDVRGERQVRQADIPRQQEWDAFEGRGQQDPEQVALELRRRDQEDAAAFKRDAPFAPIDLSDLDLVPMDAPEPATRMDQARSRVRAVLDRMRVGYSISANDAEEIAAAHVEYGEDVEILVRSTLGRYAADAKTRDEDLPARADSARRDRGGQADDARVSRPDGDGNAAGARVDQDERAPEGGRGTGAETDRGDQERAPEGARTGTRDGGRVDLTPEGEQLVIPGAEQIPDRERAERAMAQPRRGGNAPMQDDGLFGDPMSRRDLFDEISAAAAQADPNPTDAQKEAGNFRKGHVAWKGLDITIENAKGSERTGTDSDGETWSVTMPAHYGYIRSFRAPAGDELPQRPVADAKRFGDAAKALAGLDSSLNFDAVVDVLSARISALNAAIPENFAERTLRDAEAGRDFSPTDAFVEEVSRLTDVPREVWLARGGNAALLKAARNRLVADAFLFGDLGEARTLRATGYNSLDVERRAVMKAHVLGSLQDSQVFNAVVNLVPVSVVNVFSGPQGATDGGFRNQAMFQKAFAAALDDAVEVRRFIDAIAASHPVAFAAPVAKRAFSASQAGGLSDERGAAGAASGGGQGSSSDQSSTYNSTKGADGEHVDVYLGDKPDSDLVFVVDQVDAETGAFDEHKVLLGFTSLKQATAAYDAAFSDGKGPQRRGAITGTSVDEFKAWLASGDTARPWSPDVQSAQNVQNETAQAADEGPAEAAPDRPAAPPPPAAPALNPAFGTARDPLRKPGDWQAGTLLAENPDGTTEEVPAGEAVRSLMARYKLAQRLMECLDANP